MQGRTRDSVPTATHSSRIRPHEGLLEVSNPANRPSTLLHGTEATQEPTSQPRMYLGQHGSDLNEEISITSTELSSSTCASLNRSGRLDHPAQPPSDRTSSASHLVVKRKRFIGSSSPHHVRMLRDWKWEILSIFTTLCLLAGILVTLGRYNRGKQPEWPYNININSLVSVLTAVLIAQLGFVLAEIISQLKWSWFRQPHPLQDLEHYDAASRGILGSFSFLGRFFRKPRSYHAVGAALILIMSAAIGPFTQQSIKSYACQRPLHNVTASMPAASYVDSSLIVGGAFTNLLYPDMKMMTAALEGIVGSNSKAVPFDCPTGDCDFAPYSSLAYCSSCTDITSRVQEHYGPLDLTSETIFTWNYTVPDQECGLNFKSARGRPTFDTDGFSGWTPNHLILCPWDRLVPNNKSATSFMVMSTSNCSRDSQDGSSDGADCVSHPKQLPSLANSTGLVAMNCTLGLCVRDYTGRVRNGVLNETMTNSLAPNLLPEEAGTGMFKILKIPCTVDSKEYDMSNISQVQSSTGRNFSTVSIDGANVTAPMECVFATGPDLPLAIGHFLKNGLLQPKRAIGRPDEGATCSTNSFDGSAFCDPWYLEPLFRSGGPTAETISADVDGIAVGITNRLRAVGSDAYGEGPGAVPGTAIQTTVCVHVDWPWLVFPAALVLLTVVLFVAVLVVAGRSRVADGQPVWKSSALVAFFHGMDTRSRSLHGAGDNATRRGKPAREPESQPASAPFPWEESHQDFVSLESMHAKAKKIVVKLETAATGQRGFIVVNHEEGKRPVGVDKHQSQRVSTDPDRDQEILPLTQLSNNSGPQEQVPTYMQADLGIRPPPSGRRSLESSSQYSGQDGLGRQT